MLLLEFKLPIGRRTPPSAPGDRQVQFDVAYVCAPAGAYALPLRKQPPLPRSTFFGMIDRNTSSRSFHAPSKAVMIGLGSQRGI